jgi:hypothetical protein
MDWTTKKIYSFLAKRKLIFFVLFFVFLGILFPAKTAFAQWYNVLIGSITYVPMALIGVALSVIVLLSSLLAAFSGLVLSWVTSPTFINWSYTNPSTNPIIKIGLDITQPFVNMILILVLVFIALATILRLGGYQTKKLLPTFIIVALLVNFAPVICGLIVDASNIVMNYFTQYIKDVTRLTSTLKELGDSWRGFIGSPTRFEATKQVPLIANLVVLIIVNLALFLILLLFAIVFMVRYLAIWTLVILSPLAFACYILPATKKIWKLWWNQLIQWSIIGITMAFFLYLADQFAVLNPALAPAGATMTTTGGATTPTCYTCTAYEGSRYNSLDECKTACDQAFMTLGIGTCEPCSSGTGTSTPTVTGIGGAILPSLLPLAFLYLGFIFGLSTGAMGASEVIGLTKRAGKWTGAKVWEGAKTWLEEKTRFREAAGAVTKKWEEIPVARIFIPETMREYAEMRPAVDKARKKLSIYGSPELGHKAAVGDIYGKEAAAALLELVERGDSNDWFKAHMKKYGAKTVEELHNNPKYQQYMARLMQIALDAGYHSTILRGSPRLAEFAFDAGIIKEDLQGRPLAGLPREEIRKRTIERVISEARAQHIKNWEEEDVMEKRIIEAGLSRGRDFWQAVSNVKRGHLRPLEIIGEMFKEHTKLTAEQIRDLSEDQFDKLWKGFEDAYRAQGKGGFFDYLQSTRAREQGWTKEKIRELATGIKRRAARPGEAAGIEIVTPVREEYIEKKPPRGRPGVGSRPPEEPPKPPRGKEIKREE